MANVGDVLLPVLGGIAGMSPYLGSGLRSALTVSEAMARKKWRDQESQRQQEETEAEAAEQARQAEEDRALRADLEGLAEEIPQQWRAAYRYQVRQNPQKALDFYRDLKEKEMEPVERFYEPGEVGAIGKDLLEQVGPNGTVQWSGKVRGGTGNFTFRSPEPTVADSWAPEPKLVPGNPHASYYFDQDGKVHYNYDEEARAAFADQETTPQVEPDELREARMEVLAAQAKVDQYIQKKEADAGRMKSVTGDIVPVETDLDEDSTYIMLMQEVEDATARLKELMNGVRRPEAKPQPQTQSQPAEAANVPTLYFDSQGNQL